jgi:hypothetical protein
VKKKIDWKFIMIIATGILTCSGVFLNWFKVDVLTKNHVHTLNTKVDKLSLSIEHIRAVQLPKLSERLRACEVQLNGQRNYKSLRRYPSRSNE